MIMIYDYTSHPNLVLHIESLCGEENEADIQCVESMILGRRHL